MLYHPLPALGEISFSESLTSADIASSVTAVAVRSGTPKPDISTPLAFKEALLAARSIARPSPAVGGSSGDHITRVAERLGITSELGAKTVIASIAKPPGRLVADGEAELALHQLQELMAVPGIDIVGPFPGVLQGTFMFSAAIAKGAESNEGAKALIAFLQSVPSKESRSVQQSTDRAGHLCAFCGSSRTLT